MKTGIRRRTLISAVCTATLCAVVVRGAIGVERFRPVMVDPDRHLIAGQSLACRVETTGGPEDVTIYSDPLGAVSYQGRIQGSTATVSAQTATTVPNGPVTIYFTTDGSTTVSATTTAGLTNDEPVWGHPSQAPSPTPTP